MSPVSLKPSDAVEGGAVPVDQNVLWKKVRFGNYDYTRKDGSVAATTIAAIIDYLNDAGVEYEQAYSVGAPGRFTVSEDGKTLDGENISKSCNFYILMNALINAGFPENKLEGDISVLEGLYTYNIGLPEPKRTGLAPRPVAEGQTAREKVLSIPSKVLKLPWEKKGAKPAAAAAAKTGAKAAAPAASDEVVEQAIKFVGDNLTDGETTRQKLATAVFKKLGKDPNKDAIATLIFAPEFQAALLGAGYTLDGETITKN